MIEYHHVPDDRFAALAAGLGGPAAVRQLASAQQSKHLLLLRLLTEESTDDGDWGAAADLLVRAEKHNPRVVAELTSDPMVGAWAAWTTRKLIGGSDESVAAHLAQLGAVAAVAALRAGLDGEVRTQALAGSVTLPTLGTAVLGADGPAVVRISSGRAMVAGATTKVRVSEEDPAWRELRRLSAHHGGLAWSLAVEDGNPYRDCYHAPAASRLSGGEMRQWQERFAEAWRLLAQFVPERAAELAAGLRSVVPLVSEDDTVARSATARDAFGTLGLTRPRSAAEMAITLVHEFQHSKLSVLLDLRPLYRPDGVERHFAPWRSDARPTGGLLHGVYAFLGVADTWRALRSAPSLEDLATREFAFEREQVAAGIDALEGSKELTSQGRDFAAGLRRALHELMVEPLPPPAIEAARERLNRRRDKWQRDNPLAASSEP